MKNIFETLLSYKPIITEHAEFHAPKSHGNIRAVTYSYPDIFEKKYETFAFIGFPENVKGKVPAVVLVHGGLGHAYAEWVRIWNARGYAAIAMDTEGFYPQKTDWERTDVHNRVSFVHEIPDAFKRDGLSLSPVNDAMDSMDKPYEKQWMFHAVLKVILAQNILRSFENVDKVGICGISWGSVITSIALGYDDRFDFAISIYGGGFQMQNKGFCGDNFRDANVTEEYLAEKRYKNIKTPFLFLCGDDDSAFSVDANSLSYVAVKEKNILTRFSVVHNFTHSHVDGWKPDISYFFADTVCRNAKPFPSFVTSPKGRNVNVTISGEIKSAKAYFITKPIAYAPRAEQKNKWQDEPWKAVDCVIENNILSCVLPEEAKFYFVTLESERDEIPYYISSSLAEI